MRPIHTIAMLGLLAALGAGCTRDQYVPANIYHEIPSMRQLTSLRRVVLIGLKDETGQPRVAEDLTAALAQALQERGLFRVDVIDRRSPRLEGLVVDKLEPFTIAELAKMARQLNCDGVLIGRIRQFQPFPRMQMSVLLRLVDLRNGRLAWGVDEKWNSADAVIEKRIKRYFRTQLRTGYDPATWELITRSPMQFCRFVAYEMAGTLPVGHRRLAAGPGRSR